MSDVNGTNGTNGTCGTCNNDKNKTTYLKSTSGVSGKENLPWYKKLLRKLDKDN